MRPAPARWLDTIRALCDDCRMPNGTTSAAVDNMNLQLRRADHVGVEAVRPLAADEVAGSVAPAQRLNRIRDSHHAIARLLAQGLKDTEVSEATGFTQVRISILKRDPMFQELLEHYRNDVREAFVDTQARLAMLGNDLIQEMHERVLDSPESVDTRTLLEAIKITADRTGHAPVSRSVNVNINTDIASRLAEARKRAGIEAPAGVGSPS